MSLCFLENILVFNNKTLNFNFGDLKFKFYDKYNKIFKNKKS